MSGAVKSLSYRVVTFSESVDFSQATSWQGQLGDFDCTLEGGILTAKPLVPFSRSIRRASTSNHC